MRASLAFSQGSARMWRVYLMVNRPSCRRSGAVTDDICGARSVCRASFEIGHRLGMDVRQLNLATTFQ